MLRSEIPAIRQRLYSELNAGKITWEEVEKVEATLEAAAHLPPAPPARRGVGSRPRSPESLERRRQWVPRARLPPRFVARLTYGEQAVLAVIADEVRKRGQCTLPNEKIAAIAGVCRSTVKNALREARALGLITIEERRRTPRYNAPNIVRIAAPEWRSWLRLDRRNWGVKSVASTEKEERKGQPHTGLASLPAMSTRRLRASECTVRVTGRPAIHQE